MSRSSSQPLAASISSWSLPICSMSLSKLASSSGSAILAEISLKRSIRSWTGLTAISQVLADRLVEVDDRFLGDVADAHALGDGGGAVDVLVEPGHDLEQSRLAGSVFAHDADLGAVVERQIDVTQHDLVAEGLADAVHFEDEFWGHGGEGSGKGVG